MNTDRAAAQPPSPNRLPRALAEVQRHRLSRGLPVNPIFDLNELFEIARKAVAEKDAGNQAAADEHLCRLICEFFAAQKLDEIVSAATSPSNAT